MEKINKVYKYGTGEEIPEGAVYLCTKTEKSIEYFYESYSQNHPRELRKKRENNILVWHYFLVEVEKE